MLCDSLYSGQPWLKRAGPVVAWRLAEKELVGLAHWARRSRLCGAG